MYLLYNHGKRGKYRIKEIEGHNSSVSSALSAVNFSLEIGKEILVLDHIAGSVFFNKVSSFLNLYPYSSDVSGMSAPTQK